MGSGVQEIPSPLPSSSTTCGAVPAYLNTSKLGSLYPMSKLHVLLDLSIPRGQKETLQISTESIKVAYSTCMGRQEN